MGVIQCSIRNEMFVSSSSYIKKFSEPSFAFAVCGFACSQALVFSLFYMGLNISVDIEHIVFERADLLFTLASMVCSFVFVRAVSPRARDALLSGSLLWCYAGLLVVGSFISSFMASGIGAVFAEGVLVGFPAGILLVAWGRAFGCRSIQDVVNEVFLAAILTSILCFVLMVVPSAYTDILLIALAIVSIACLKQLKPFAVSGREPIAQKTQQAQKADSTFSFGDIIATREQHDETARLSKKILTGTGLFGLTAGFMGTFASDPGTVSVPTFSASLILLILFCIAALQLLGSGKNPNSQESLDGVYRLSILVMMGGFLFVPVLGSFGVPGEAIMLAGFLGLIYVLISLFLVVAKLTGQDAAVSFARGFTILYFGQIIGIVLGSAIEMFEPTGQVPYVIASCAGLIALFAYLFLFTERDFRELSVIVEQADRFEDACRVIAQEYGLSKRESEILPQALKGRTGERIASEFFISKSTVETHLRRIYVKTGTHGRQELIDLGEKTVKKLLSS